MYKTLRPLIYRLTPEQAHHVTITLLRLAGAVPPARSLLDRLFRPRVPGPQVQVFGLTFANPLGMAAGYDKDGLGWRGLACLGFGHIELGTVTPRPQPGNPQPRLFRLVEDRAVINRMGFNNCGADFMARRLRGPRPKGFVLGVNIGKNKVTPLENAAEDYLTLLRVFAPLADYLAVNVSSPNTPGLRSLQTRAALEGILKPLAAEKQQQANRLNRNVPVLVKLAPDLTDEELDAALEVILETGMDGVIINNTTISRPPLRSPLAAETGGLSGAPICSLSQAMTEKVAWRLNGRLPIVASGGVMSAADAQARLDAGASLVQLYTGLIYEGPGLVKQILDSGLLVNIPPVDREGRRRAG
ncbi:MAG: quinone-dependent dihydroorotate dehydrogenase [Chloroflexi bacterium]|nr:quinone-dependent dihydroorotate dehydrogenase [Chloroflexota bacterium]